MTVVVIFAVAAAVALVFAAMSFRMARLYGHLAALDRLVAAMLRNPERAGDLADEYAHSHGYGKRRKGER